MKVEIEAETARTLALWLQGGTAQGLLPPPLHDASLELLNALEDLDRPTADEFTRPKVETVWCPDCRTEIEVEPEVDVLAPVPHWEYVAKATRLVREVLSDPMYVARADALSAYVRDTFDALGISVRHEPSIYVALTTAGLLVEMAGNGLEAGHTTEEAVHTIAQVAQSFTASLLDYLPPEAR